MSQGFDLTYFIDKSNNQTKKQNKKGAFWLK